MLRAHFFGRYVAFLALVQLSTTSVFAAAALPDDQTIRYELFEIPGDVTSTVEWTVDVQFAAVSRVGSTVVWAIQRVVVTHVDSAGDRVWIGNSPDVTTTDGRWHIAHADPLHPEVTEFSNPPQVSGMGIASIGGAANLGFMIAGPIAGPIPSLDTWLKCVNQQTPLRETSAETVNIKSGGGQ